MKKTTKKTPAKKMPDKAAKKRAFVETLSATLTKKPKPVTKPKPSAIIFGQLRFGVEIIEDLAAHPAFKQAFDKSTKQRINRAIEEIKQGFASARGEIRHLETALDEAERELKGDAAKHDEPTEETLDEDIEAEIKDIEGAVEGDSANDNELEDEIEDDDNGQGHRTRSAEEAINGDLPKGDTCVCGDPVEEHGHDDEHPNSTACTVPGCDCIAYESNGG